jgi:hypothetical protein
VAKTVAQRLVEDGKVRVLSDSRITTVLETGKAQSKAAKAREEYDKRVAAQTEATQGDVEATTPKPGDRILDAIDRVAAEKKAAKKTTPAVNGRKAKADRMPYSSATPTGSIKRHGKSRRTGTETQIVDLLAKNGPEAAAKAMGQDKPMALVGSGRYAVQCITHKQTKTVPDMTEGKPLQARTDQFCKQCAKAVAEKTDAA